MDFVEELKWRGMIHSVMPGTEEMLKQGMQTAYVGITTAAKYHAIVVGQATPAAPALQAKMPMAFPATLTRFMATETSMVVRVFPMERYSAAPAL